MQKYTITAVKPGTMNEDGSEYEIESIDVMAECHRQHIWTETTLVGVSKAGARKLAAFDAAHDGHISLDVPNAPRLIGWEIKDV